MSIGVQKFTSVDDAIDRLCDESHDLKMAVVYIGDWHTNMDFDLGQEYDWVDIDENSVLEEAYLNDEKKEMILINEGKVRIYKYRDKEMYKTDARILRTKSERIKAGG